MNRRTTFWWSAALVSLLGVGSIAIGIVDHSTEFLAQLGNGCERWVEAGCVSDGSLTARLVNLVVGLAVLFLCVHFAEQERRATVFDDSWRSDGREQAAVSERSVSRAHRRRLVLVAAGSALVVSIQLILIDRGEDTTRVFQAVF